MGQLPGVMSGFNDRQPPYPYFFGKMKQALLLNHIMDKFLSIDGAALLWMEERLI